MGSFLASRIMTDIFGGVATGAVIALIALSLVIIYQSTHVLNFAQGAMSMFGTFVGMNLVFHGMNYWLCLLLSVATGMVLGGLTERVLIRPLYGKPEINPIVVMIGFLGVLEALISSIWQTNITMLPSPFSQIYYQSAHRTILVSPFIIYEVLTVAIVVGAMALLFQKTNIGLQMRAAAFAPEVARLLGVRVSRLLTLGWMLSTIVGTLAAVVVSTGQVLAPTNMDGIFVSAFIAAAVGGLESPMGSIVAGLAIGLVEQFILDFWSPSIAPLSGVIVLVIGLSLRPEGLFTRHTSRRV